MGTGFWEEHVAAAKLESTSASEYARRHGLAVSALYYWQHKHVDETTVPVLKAKDKKPASNSYMWVQVG